jgi:hypothetical protein
MIRQRSFLKIRHRLVNMDHNGEHPGNGRAGRGIRSWRQRVTGSWANMSGTPIAQRTADAGIL